MAKTNGIGMRSNIFNFFSLSRFGFFKKMPTHFSVVLLCVLDIRREEILSKNIEMGVNMIKFSANLKLFTEIYYHFCVIIGKLCVHCVERRHTFDTL